MFFSKKTLVFTSIFAITFGFGIGDAYAYCDRNHPIGPGKYCQHTVEYSCVAGCYCWGAAKGQKLSIQWADGVSKACENRWSKVNTELCNNQFGVCLCPDAYPKSNGGSSTASDCYRTNSAGTKIYNKKYKCDAGKYLPADSPTCTSCPKNYYCPGVNVMSSKTEDQGKTACPSGLQSMAESKSSADCKQYVTCKSGEYLPANAKACSACLDNFYCLGGTFAVSASHQGLQSCGPGQSINESRTGCTDMIKCSAGTYLPANSTTCAPCPERYGCKGGSYMPNSPTEQGIVKLKEFSITHYMLAYGAAGEGGNIEEQCWYFLTEEGYKKCIENAIRAHENQ